jgi:hypothetical protein
MTSINKSDVNLLTRKDASVMVKPVYAWSGWTRYVAGYVATGYGFTSKRFPRRGMADAWVKSFFRGNAK